MPCSKPFLLATSGYHSLTLSNGSIITVYCDMEGSNCDNKGGWMRVGYLNLTRPSDNKTKIFCLNVFH